MAVIYESLCMELDKLLLDIIQDMESYTKSKVDLEKTLNNGYVNIAKTRYISGATSVTAHQLPTQLSNPIQPLVKVLRTERKGNHGSTQEIQIINNLTAEKNNETGLWKRGETTAAKQENLPFDPIRFFGVLVPQSLRMAQKSFVKGVEQLSTTTQTHCDLDYKLQRYSKLIDIKHRLTAEE